MNRKRRQGHPRFLLSKLVYQVIRNLDRIDSQIAIITRNNKTSKTIIKYAYVISGLIMPYLNFDWIGALIFASLGPFILVSLHTLCNKDSCKPALPFNKIPKKLANYWDKESFLLVVAFMLVLRVLSFLPLGGTVRSVSGKDLRMNGFVSLLILMATMPLMVYKKINLR